MARPLKKGLDYFPLNTDFFEDEKIVAISGEFGLKGEIAAVKLLCAIYRNGYFAVWDDLFKYKLLKSLPGISPDLLESIVSRLVSWGFFNQDLFHSTRALTSKGIQARFFAASKRRRNDEDLPYLLGQEDQNGVIARNNGVSAYKNPECSELLHAKTPQRKEKKRKYIKEESLKEESANEIEAYSHELERQDTFWETAAMRFHKPPDELRGRLRDFLLEQQCQTRTYDNFGEFTRHFFNWLRIDIKNQKNNEENQSRGRAQRRGNLLTSEKTKAYTDTF